VVTVGPGQERFLDEALDSVRRQTYRRTDHEVVRWGPGGEASSLAEAHQLALTRARSPMVRLLEASDTLPPRSTALLVRALGRSSAPSAAGPSVPAVATWRDHAFAAPGQHPGLGDRLLHVARWRAMPAPADPVLAPAEPVREVTHVDHGRATGLSFARLRPWAAELDEHLPRLAVLAASGDVAAVAAALDRQLPRLLEDVESFSDAQWASTVRTAGELLRAVGDTAAEHVRAEARVRAWLAAHDRREALEDLVARRWRSDDDLPTSVRDGAVLADLGVDGVPDEVARLGATETPLELRVLGRSGSQVELLAFIRQVPTDREPGVVVRDHGRLSAHPVARAAASRLAAESERDHAHGWIVVDDVPRGRRALEVELTSHGVTRAGRIPVPAGDREVEQPHDLLADDEAGPHAQQVLRRWYAGDHPIEPDLAYFQSYTGQAATDSPLAIHRELRRLRPDIRVRWLVDHPGVPLPEGAEPVLWRSREWYHTLATARWIVTNIEQELWFRRKPGQDLLQTFHGAPGKAMGLGLWRSNGLTPRRIERLLDAGPRNWTALLSPSPELSRHYREQFAYDGPILEEGYPRDDVLVGPDASAIRARVRAALGLRDDQVAVLYAPTWRDRLATNYRRARMHDDFDPAAAAAALGDRYVILLRGHRFHRDRDAYGERVLDVTTYPEVNDLILAADAAVLDYSSIRFDVALTPSPMVFCVPDLEEYSGGRGFLYDFLETAPGPPVRTTEEVVACLRDLPGLEAEYAEARRVFHERFNAHQDGHAAERVVRAFFGTGPEGPGSAH
jgi:CDP-glycerol glycerophosphotransferase (TagB/SpsB family)